MNRRNIFINMYIFYMSVKNNRLEVANASMNCYGYTVSILRINEKSYKM